MGKLQTFDGYYKGCLRNYLHLSKANTVLIHNKFITFTRCGFEMKNV